MTQYALPVIDPNVTTGTDLANYLNSWKPALLSQHAGAARPSYAVAGQLWVEQVSASLWNLKLYTGTLDGIVGQLNPTTGVFSISGAGAFTTLTTSGNTTLGDAAADTLTVNATATFAALAPVTLSGGDLVVSRNFGTGVVAQVYNTNNVNALSNATFHAKVGGSGAGDPVLYLEVTGVLAWSVGVDNSDSDQFKIGPNGIVGTGTILTIHPTSLVTTLAGDLLVQRANVGGLVGITLANTNNSNVASHARLGVSAGGAAGGDPLLYMDISGVAAYCLGIDNSDSDIFKICAGGVIGTSTLFQLTALGVAAFNNILYVNGVGAGQALQILDATNAAGAQIALLGNGGTNPNKFIRSCLGTFEIIKSDYSAVILALGDTGALGIGGASGGTGFTAAGSFVQPLGAGIKSRSAFSAWVRHDGAGTIIRSFNCATVTKNSAGSFTYTWTAGVMGDGSYGYFATAKQAGTVIQVYVGAPAPTASQLVVQCTDHNGVATDPAEITCGILP